MGYWKKEEKEVIKPRLESEERAVIDVLITVRRLCTDNGSLP